MGSVEFACLNVVVSNCNDDALNGRNCWGWSVERACEEDERLIGSAVSRLEL